MRRICGNCFAEIKGGKCPVCGYSERAAGAVYDALPVGTTVGAGYTIGRVIGRGGFGLIYLAYDPVFDRAAAVKEYFPDGMAVRAEDNVTVEPMTSMHAQAFAQGLDRFLAEAQTIAQFKECSEIIGLYDVFSENGTAYYAMEYFSGDTLLRYTEVHGALSEGQAVHIAAQILPALAVLHKNNTLHRDVSPENIMLCGGRVRLIDFGSARSTNTDKGLSVVLKPGFAPLEQYRRNAPQDGRADLYSLGATLFYALTLNVPNDPISRLDNDRTFEKALRALTPQLAAVIGRACAVRAESRYARAEDMLEAINACGISEEGFDEAPREPLRRKKRRGALPFVAAAAAALTVAGAGTALLIKKSAPAEAPVQSVQESAPAQVIIGGEAFPDNLTSLDLADRGLTDEDISGLCNMKQLTFLKLDGNPITDLSCLEGLVGLESVHFNNTDVSDIDFVRGMDRLRSISGEYTQVSDLSPLKDKTLLESAFFGDSRVTDISPVAGSAGLKKVGFNRLNIDNIDALAGKTELETACLTGCGLKSIEPLRDSKRLKYLYLGVNRISDVSPLSGCNFTELYVNYNPLSDGGCFDGISVIKYLAIDHSGLTRDDLLYILRNVNGTYRYQYTYDPDDPYCGEDRARLEDLEELEGITP